MQIFFTLLFITILCPATAQAMPTPQLIQAVQSSSMNFLGQLIRGGANINAIDILGRTAAHHAVAQNNLDALQLLLDEGAEVNLSDNQGKTLLDLWQTHKDADMLILLQKAGARHAYTEMQPATKASIETEISIETDTAGKAQDLWQAAASNDLVAAKRLLAEGADAKAKNAEGKAPFHIAVEAEYYSLAAILLKAAQGINGRDEKSWTPLMWAIVADDWDLVREFLDDGADIKIGRQQNALDIAEMTGSEEKLFKVVVEEKGVDASVVATALKMKDAHSISIRDIIGWAPLKIAILVDDWDLVRELLNDGTDLFADFKLSNALDVAAMMGSEEKLLGVVVEEKGVDTSIVATIMKMKDAHSISIRNIIRWTPLMLAILADDWDLVRELLNDGVDLFAGYEKENALDVAAMMGSEEKLFEAMLEQGTDLNVQNKDGYTVLIWAVEYGKTETVALLLEHGTNIEAKDKRGQTLLMQAGRMGKTKTVALLLERGANIEAKDPFGGTALIHAAEQGKTETVKLLLERGANIEVQDKYGKTALVRATFWEKTEVVKLLLKHGANIEAKDTSGWTALLFAAGKGYTETVKLLLAHGANIEANVTGSTALHLAAREGYTETVALLLAHGANIEAQDNFGWTALMHAEESANFRKTAQLLHEHSEGSLALQQE